MIWLTSRAGKMNQILPCDWLPVREIWGYLGRTGLPAVFRKKMVPCMPYNKSFLLLNRNYIWSFENQVFNMHKFIFLACVHYQNLTSGDRKYTHGREPLQCDNHLEPGWFRFRGAAGTKMASTYVPIERCSTDAPGWLNGTHPAVAEGEVTRQVCFHWSKDCCHWTTYIHVKNCGDFFVYFTNGTYRAHPCHLRYCGAD